MSETDPKATAILLLQTITKFQESLHTSDSNDEHDWVRSDYLVEKPKKSWNIELSVPLTHSERNSESADTSQSVYKADNEFDFLISTFLIFETPRVRVRKEFTDSIRIRWCYNLPHNAIRSARLYINGQATPTVLNRHIYDIKSALYMKPGAGMRELYDYKVGNTPDLQNWCIELPARKLTPPQPWYYAEHRENAIPLFLLPQNYKIEHVYNFNKPFDILMMSYKGKDNKWRLIKPNAKVLEFITPDTKFKTPVMMGRYSKLPDPKNDNDYTEKKWHIGPECPPHSYLVTNYEIFNSKNPCPAGEKVEIDIMLSTPARAMYILAENKVAKTKHNFSNYTTDPENVNHGLNPIESLTDMFDRKPHSKLEQYQLDRANIWYSFQSAPLQLGYNVRSLYGSVADRNCNTGIVLGNYMPYSAQIKLVDSNDQRIDSDQSTDPQATERILEEIVNNDQHKDIDPDQLYDITVIIETYYRITFNNKEAIKFEGVPGIEKI